MGAMVKHSFTIAYKYETESSHYHKEALVILRGEAFCTELHLQTLDIFNIRKF